MIKYNSKLSEWLRYTLVGASRSGKFKLRLLQEDVAERDGILEELRQYVLDVHKDALRHHMGLDTGSLNPFEEQLQFNPYSGYPHKLHIKTLKGYFGEIFVAIVAENFSPFEIDNWEVPAFLFGTHNVVFEHIEAVNRTGREVKHQPGRTGDDCLAFQRDGSGKIIRVLYCEAKCSAGHESDMLTEAYEKVDKSVPVDFSAYIEVLKERGSTSAKKWVDAIREVWLEEKPSYEQCNLVSYVCGQHPKRKRAWHLESEPYKNYRAKRRLEGVEIHLYDVDSLIREVYSVEQLPEKAMQPDRTQKGETTIHTNRETLILAGRLRENHAGAKIPKSLAKLIEAWS